MKAHTKKYLTEINVDAVVMARIQAALDNYNTIIGKEYETVILSDSLNKEGNRTFDSMWLVGKDFFSEVKSLLTADVIDFARVKAINYFEITSKEYNFKKATESSRLAISITFITTSEKAVGASIEATGSNCDFLFAFHKAYILPRA